MVDLKRETPTPVSKRPAMNWAETFEKICAATTPATIADADDPSPRLWGIPLRASRHRSAGMGVPSRANPWAIARTTRCVASRGTSSALSPDTATRSPWPSPTVTSYSSHSPRANPTESKPGPRLAVLPGTRMCTAGGRPGIPVLTRQGPGPPPP